DFRAEYGARFGDVAEDRFDRERAAGASGSRAALKTMRLLVADTIAGRRLARSAHARLIAASAPARRPLMIDRLAAHLPDALRSLVRAPLVALVATLTVAVGLGATAAMLTIIDALVLSPARGIADPSRLVDIGRPISGELDTLSYPTFADIRDRM